MNIEEFREKQKTFQSSDGNIKFIDVGAGDEILLLHGIPTSSWLYRKMINALVEKGNRVIIPDMLGFGNSDNPDGYKIYSSKEHAKRIIELMDSLNVKTWNHVMHDAGGLWTWELLKDSPNRIQKLILLNTLILKDGFFPPIKMKEGIFSKFILSLYSKKLSSTLLLKMLFKNGLNNYSLSKSEFEGYQKPLLEGKIKAMYYFFTQLSQPFPNYEEVLKQLNIPVLIIWGKDDKILKWEAQSQQVLKLLKIDKNNIHYIEGNHFLQEENPNIITTKINGFIEEYK